MVRAKEETKEPEIEETAQDSTEEPVTEEVSNPGDMVNFSKEIDYGVADEEGDRIPCRSLAEAKILSLLLELKEGVK